MKKLLLIAALGACALPLTTLACEYDDSTAAASNATRLGLAPAPEASKAPAQNVVKASVQKAAKQKVAKERQSADTGKVAALTPQ